jgi:hypothetical protein
VTKAGNQNDILGNPEDNHGGNAEAHPEAHPEAQQEGKQLRKRSPNPFLWSFDANSYPWIVRKTTQDPANEPTQSATTAEQSGPHDDAQLSLPELAPAVPQLTPTPGPSNKLAASPRPGAYVNTHIGKPENVMEPLSPIPTTEAMHKPNKKPNKKPSKKLDKKPTHLPPNEKTYTLQSRKCTS